MAHVTKSSLVRIIGTVDDETSAAIRATGASPSDVEQAKAILTGTNDIVGSGETFLPGVVREVLTILEARAARIGQRYHDALLDPPGVFEQPADVCADKQLSHAQKIEVLRRWEYDAREISVAEDEGMPAADGRALQEVLLALETLGVHVDTRRSAPTRQGGLDRQALRGTEPEHN